MICAEMSLNKQNESNVLVDKVRSAIFCILLIVHLGIILINTQLDAQFLLYIFISILYMFRATLCSSSGQSIVSIQHLVYVTLCR
jgi:hypothetical protein